MKTLSECQEDMRLGYLSGGPGVLVSAIAWLVAGTVALLKTPQTAVWALFIGGMLIHPVGVVLTKIMGRTGNHTSGNPLGSLAAANTVWLILMCPLAYVVSLQRIEWFFPAMLLVIGGRYMTFHMVFGMRIYWLCGVALALAGVGLGMNNIAPAISAYAGAAIEAIFAVAIIVGARRSISQEVVR